MQAYKQGPSVVGVGLRHSHFEAALTTPADIDFVEVHSENFLAQGGILPQVLEDIHSHYRLSLHCTSLGLGSAAGIPDDFLAKLKQLDQKTDAFLISDHAAFSWAQVEGQWLHSGDLLPLVYNRENLEIMAANVDRVQQVLGRRILVENLSAYLHLPGSDMCERDFLLALCQQTQCGLLLDLNNILVNAFNQSEAEPLAYAMQWLEAIPRDSVGEIHLAGFTPSRDGGLIIDDHAKPVSALCWDLYRHAIKRFGNIPTLIEWDNDLPEWQVLLDEASKARVIANEVLAHE